MNVREACELLELPNSIASGYEAMGISQLYPWQEELLRALKSHDKRTESQNINHYDGSIPSYYISDGTMADPGPSRPSCDRNVVYCASTSAGKSLVADLCLLRALIIHRDKVMIVLPYVSMVIEKEKYLRKLLRPYNRDMAKHQKVKLRSVHGDHGGYNIYKDHIFVTTIEKANRIFNDMSSVMLDKYSHIESARRLSVGCIVIDEMHSIGSTFNGYLLEILISKALMISSHHKRIQLVAMSATISNVHELAQWMRAIPYQTNFRPVPLEERIVAGSVMYDSSGHTIESIDCSHYHIKPDDKDVLVSLCLRAIFERQQKIIIFCPTKDGCVASCRKISTAISEYSSKYGSNTTEKVLEAREQLKQRLKSASSIGRPNDALSDGVTYGVAFHTSNLRSEERSLVEKGFKDGTLQVIVATSTLAAGSLLIIY